MAKGSFESFRIELVLDIDQRRAWSRISSEARSVHAAVQEELSRQLKKLGFVVAKSLILEGRAALDVRRELSHDSFQHARSWAYDSFSPPLRPRGRRANVPVLVDPGSVSFSVSDNVVRIPYLGLVRHKPNRRIVPSGGAETENKAWLLANVKTMDLREVNNSVCLVVDCSEEGGRRPPTKRRTRRRRAEGWLEDPAATPAASGEASASPAGPGPAASGSPGAVAQSDGRTTSSARTAGTRGTG